MRMTHELQMRAMRANFHRRDLKFSDIPDTITIFKHNEKKMINLITSGN